MTFTPFKPRKKNSAASLRVGASGSLCLPKFIAERYGYKEGATYEIYIDEKLCLLGIKFLEKDEGKKLYGIHTLNIPLKPVFNNLGLCLPSAAIKVNHDLKEDIMAIDLSEFKFKMRKK